MPLMPLRYYLLTVRCLRSGISGGNSGISPTDDRRELFVESGGWSRAWTAVINAPVLYSKAWTAGMMPSE